MKRSIGALLLMMVAAIAAVAAPPRDILVFGDSISAGYGIRVEQGWVSLLQGKLSAQGYGERVINASVSGETTAGGLARLPRALSVHRPEIVILELGGNDGLRALPIEQMRDNLRRMIGLCKQANAQVLLVGMRIPPNYGPAYTRQFQAVFDELAHQYRIAYVPFLLDGVALDSALMQADLIHPNAQGQPRLLQNVWPVLAGLLHKH